MNQQLQSWRTGKGQTLWLARLVDAMEKISGADRHAHRIDRLELAAIRAQLGRPAAPHPARLSRFSLRN
jgi:hypothetical protein